MTGNHRIAAIRLANKIDRNKAYAKKVGVSVEMMKNKEKANEKKVKC